MHAKFGACMTIWKIVSFICPTKYDTNLDTSRQYTDWFVYRVAQKVVHFQHTISLEPFKIKWNIYS